MNMHVCLFSQQATLSLLLCAAPHSSTGQALLMLTSNVAPKEVSGYTVHVLHQQDKCPVQPSLMRKVETCPLPFQLCPPRAVEEMIQ